MIAENMTVIIGRLARDPSEAYSPKTQKAVVRFTVAVDRPKNSNGESTGTDFISCIAFGALGEQLMRRGKKGAEIYVRGRISTGSYEKDGRKVYTTDVKASALRVWLSDARTPVQDGGAPESYASGQDDWTAQTAMEGFFEDDSIPF